MFENIIKAAKNSLIYAIGNISDLYIDTQELLRITDILITDYSSCYFDFLLTEKPIIFYPFDFKEYSKSQGFFFDYQKVNPGKIVYNEDSLIDAIEDYLINPEIDKQRRIKLKNKFHKHQDGQYSKRVFLEIRKLINYAK